MSVFFRSERVAIFNGLQGSVKNNIRVGGRNIALNNCHRFQLRRQEELRCSCDAETQVGWVCVTTIYPELITIDND